MIEIQEYDSQVSITELTDLIHRSYRQLADLGFKYWGTHQSSDVTKERIAKGQCYVSFQNNQLVGTIVLNSPENSTKPPNYQTNNSCSFHQFAIDPSYQKQNIGSQMMDFIEHKAIEHGRNEILCDTAEGASHLVNMYLNRGYKIIDKVSWDGTNYTSVIMSKRLN